ncbi:MAG: nuclear transport factor 2 family protein [Vicinamibacterales bacterium]
MADPDSLVGAYFSAWNAHDGATLAGLFSDGGTYEDPTTEGPVPASMMPRVADALTGPFPDVAFERRSTTGTGTRRVAEWVMRGHNQGPLGPGTNPTGRAVALRGIDAFDLESDSIGAVRRYFDRQSLVEQAGLMALVQPVEQGPAQYGYSMRVASGNHRPPRTIALTWIQGANEAEKERIRVHSRQNVQDFLTESGFISIVTGFTGLRGFTVTAWEDEAAMTRALSKDHATAMRELFAENFVSAVWTSVWQPTRINRIWVRCRACASLADVTDDHRTCRRCGTALQERPAFW